MSDHGNRPGCDQVKSREHGDGHNHHHHQDHERQTDVLVNEKPVVLRHQDQTGLSIKEAAIAQGAGIELDFVLSIERGGGKTELVGDDDHIKVHSHERFLAIPNDDNS